MWSPWAEASSVDVIAASLSDSTRGYRWANKCLSMLHLIAEASALSHCAVHLRARDFVCVYVCVLWDVVSWNVNPLTPGYCGDGS